MTEQFGAIPVRAFRDTKLSAADLRVLGAIAYFDRFGKNGYGCIAGPVKLAEAAAVNYKNLGRHTTHLKKRGYIQIIRSATDRRKRGYVLIYNEDQVVVVNSDDNRGRDDARGATVAPLDDKVVNAEDNPIEKVVKPNSQAVDPVAKPLPKRLCEAYLKDPAKRGAQNGENTSRHDTEKSTHHARQGVRGGGNSGAQEHLKWGPHALKGRNQLPRNQPSAPDWNGWAAWLQSDQRMTKEAAWSWLMATLERIETERGVDSTEAGKVLDRELKRRRKAAA